jgi:hypothetical protein
MATPTDAGEGGASSVPGPTATPRAGDRQGWLDRVIAWSLDHRLMTLLAAPWP